MPVNVSKELIWECVRKNSAFLRFRRNCPKTFSVEKYNVTKLNSPRYNGLINLGNVDIRLSKKGKVVVDRRTKVPSQPKKFCVSHTITSNSPRIALKRVAKKTASKKGHGYLVKPAQRRASLLLRSLQKIKKMSQEKSKKSD